jgi:hypothetical protein
MAAKKLTAKQAEKAQDARITKAYGQACHGVQVPIMELPRIFKHAKEADARGEDLVQAIRAFVRTIVGAVEGGEALGG